MSNKVYVKDKKDVPEGEHWAILTFSSVSTPGWDAGDPHDTLKILEYVAFTNETEWQEEIRRIEARHTRILYSAIFVKPAIISTNIEIS